MSRVATYCVTEFTGGLNDTVALDSLKENELVAADNVNVFKSGGIEVRYGCKKLNSASYAAEVDQDIMMYLSNGVALHFVMIDKDLYKVNATTYAVTKLKDLARETIGWFVYEDKLFFVDGTGYYVYGYYEFTSASGSEDIAKDDIVKNIASSGGGIAGHFYKAKSALGVIALGTENYANTTNWEDVTDGYVPNDIRDVPVDGKGVVAGNDLTNIKKCTILEFHPLSYRLFAAGNSDAPTALYYSEVDNPYAFISTSILLPTSSAGSIKGLKSFMQSMLVSYERVWMYWDGIEVGTDVEWGRLPIPTGCLNHNAVALTPYSMTFWGTDGLYIIYPGMLIRDSVVLPTKELYTKIDDNKVETAVKSMKNPENVRVVFHDGNVYFAYGTEEDERNNTVLVLNWELKCFVKYTGWQVNDWHITALGELGFASLNYLLQQDTTSYNDINVTTGEEKAIEPYAKTVPFKLGSITNAFLQKELRHVYLSAKQYVDEDYTSKVSITVGSDYLDVGPNIADINLDLIWGREWELKYGFVDLVVLRVESGKNGFRHSVILESDSLDNHWLIYALGFEYVVLDGSEAMAVNAPKTAWITD